MRLNSLDTLRGLAALAVAVPHYFMIERVGGHLSESLAIVSVEVFFVLSGFVLAPQILFCLDDKFWSRFRIFLIRRWLRTLPPFVLAITAMAILTSNVFGIQYFKYITFTYNLLFLDESNNYFPIAWSLSVEEWYYIIFPAFIAATLALGVNTGWAIVGFLVLLLLSRFIGAAFDPDFWRTSREVVIYRLDSICFGFVCYIVLTNLPQLRRPQVIAGTAASLLISATLLVLLMESIYDNESVFARLIYFYVAMIFSVSLLVSFYFLEPLFKHRTLAAPTSWLGELSYDFYLFHIPVILVLDSAMPGNSYQKFLVYLFALAACSYGIRVWFERPILKIRPKYQEHQGDDETEFNLCNSEARS